MEGKIRTVSHYNILLSKVLGKGSFGTVYKAYDTKKKIFLAVKTVKIGQLASEGECMYGKEYETLCNLKGKHIVKLLDAIEDDINFYLFFEFCEGGDLSTVLGAQKYLTERYACSIIKQIVQAFLDQDQQEENGKMVCIIHRDIKPENILFRNGELKVADFGMAKFIDYCEKNIKKGYELCGTPYYQAPQILNSENYSAKCDIWSTGVLFYELLFGKLPWTGYTEKDLYLNIRFIPLRFPKTISLETYDLLINMLKFREEDRISWMKIYLHPALDMSRFDREKKKEIRLDQNIVNPQILNIPKVVPYQQYRLYDVNKYHAMPREGQYDGHTRAYNISPIRYADPNKGRDLESQNTMVQYVHHNKPDYGDYRPEIPFTKYNEHEAYFARKP